MEFYRNKKHISRGKKLFGQSTSSISDILYYQQNGENRFFRKNREYNDASSQSHNHLNQNVYTKVDNPSPLSRTNLRYLHDDRSGAQHKSFHRNTLKRQKKDIMRIFTESPKEEFCGTERDKNFSAENVLPFEGRGTMRTKQVTRYQRKLKNRNLKPQRKQIMCIPRRFEVPKSIVKKKKVAYRNILNYQIKIKMNRRHNRMKVLDD